MILGGFALETERPLRPRQYEEEWDFDRGIVRCCLQGTGEEGRHQFVRLLRAIQKAYGPLLMEADEAYGSADYVKGLFKKELFLMDPTVEKDPRERSSALLSHGAINYYNISYACVVDSDCIERVVTRLDVMEWWGSCWHATRPYSFLAEAIAGGRDRVEPVMLASIEECSPLFFLAPSHNHLEIMARESQANHLLDLIIEIGQKC